MMTQRLKLLLVGRICGVCFFRLITSRQVIAFSEMFYDGHMEKKKTILSIGRF